MCISKRWGGGAGARLGRDGMDGIQVHVTNTSNLPVEALENEYPLLVEEYGLWRVRAAPGGSRGGLGIARQIRALEDGTVFGCRSDSHLTRAEGVFGGEPGRPGRLVHNPGRPGARELPSKVSRLVLQAGESMRIETPGGGGAGPPGERIPERRAEDVRSGKVLRGGRSTLRGNDADRALHYGPTAKVFHWIIAALIVIQLPLGWLMPDIHRGQTPGLAMTVHVSIGMTILLLIVLRLLWRLTHPVAPEIKSPALAAGQLGAGALAALPRRAAGDTQRLVRGIGEGLDDLSVRRGGIAASG